MTLNSPQVPDHTTYTSVDSFIADIREGESVENAFSSFRERKVKEAWYGNSVRLNHSQNAVRTSLIDDLQKASAGSNFDSRNILSLKFSPQQTERVIDLYLKAFGSSEKAGVQKLLDLPKKVNDYFGGLLSSSGRKQLLSLLKSTSPESITPEFLENLVSCLRGLASNNAKAKVLRYLTGVAPDKRAERIQKGSLATGNLTHGKERVAMLIRVQDIPSEQINDELLEALTVLIPTIESSQEGSKELIKAIREIEDTQKSLLINFVAAMCLGEESLVPDISEKVKGNSFIKAKLIRAFTRFLKKHSELTSLEQLKSLVGEDQDKAQKIVRRSLILGNFESSVRNLLSV
ncbi:MAG: hypothetical protein ACI9S8_002775 [Chlamydiales bacterium]|jgi:hypothetical protein